MPLEKISLKDALLWGMAVCVGSALLAGCGTPTLPKEERIIPGGAVVLKAYRHKTDGKVTVLSQEKAETLYLQPDFYKGILECRDEEKYYDLREFEWVKTGENLWDWRVRRYRELHPLLVGPLDTYPLRQEKEGVLVIADPYVTKRKLEKAFPNNIAPFWGPSYTYPVQLFVHNAGRKEVLPKTIRFLWPGQEGIPPSSVDTVLNPQGFRKAAPGSLTMGRLYGAMWTSFGMDLAENFRIFKEQLTTYQFKTGLVSKGDTLSGLLYLTTLEDLDEISEVKLQVTIFDTDKKEALNFEIPIPRQYLKEGAKEWKLWKEREEKRRFEEY